MIKFPQLFKQQINYKEHDGAFETPNQLNPYVAKWFSVSKRLIQITYHE